MIQLLVTFLEHSCLLLICEGVWAAWIGVSRSKHSWFAYHVHYRVGALEFTKCSVHVIFCNLTVGPWVGRTDVASYFCGQGNRGTCGPVVGKRASTSLPLLWGEASIPQQLPTLPPYPRTVFDQPLPQNWLLFRRGIPKKTILS